MRPSQPVNRPRRSLVAVLLAATAAVPAQARSIDAGGGANQTHQQELPHDQAARPLPGSSDHDGADPAATRAALQQAMERRRQELRPEYERRLRSDGQASANAWLRAEAARLGRLDGQALRRPSTAAPDAAATAAANAQAAPARAADAADAGKAATGTKGTRKCAQVRTRNRVVPSVNGGPMQMALVTECVPAPAR